MIPTMLVLGLVLGSVVPRSWPHSTAVTALLAVLVSLAFGFFIGEPVVGSALALANAAIGVGVGRLAQRVVVPPRRRVA